MKFFSQLLLLSFNSASAFLFYSPEAPPGLSKIIDAQSVQRLTIDLDIGKDDDSTHLAIRDVVFDLFKDPPTHEHVSMPGKNGPHPKVSSGIRRLDIIEGGHFISLAGTNHIQALKSCWEVNWAKDNPAGALICGFELEKEYTRNAATLPKGRIYLSFPIWNQEGLDYARKEKTTVMKKAEEALKEKNEEMSKFQDTNNILMKALHYRNAYAAAEAYWNQPVKRMKMVPDEGEVIFLQDDLLLTTKGLIWSKELPRGGQVLLGSASISTKTMESESIF
jgi:hypothetical protein